jgi:hypothetical protein
MRRGVQAAKRRIALLVEHESGDGDDQRNESGDGEERPSDQAVEVATNSGERARAAIRKGRKQRVEPVSNPADSAALEQFARLSRAVSSPLSLAAALHTTLCDAGIARTASLCLLRADGETLELIEAGLYPTEVASPWSTFPLDADLPASEVVRTHAPLYVTRDELIARYPIFGSSPTLGSGAIGIVPIGARGALVTGYADTEPVPPTTRELLERLAALTDTALERLDASAGE